MTRCLEFFLQLWAAQFSPDSLGELFHCDRLSDKAGNVNLGEDLLELVKVDFKSSDKAYPDFLVNLSYLPEKFEARHFWHLDVKE